MTDWFASALCSDLDPEVFFPHPSETDLVAEAQAICALCPAAIECEAYAFSTRQRFGVWGGVLFDEVKLPHRSMRVCRWCGSVFEGQGPKKYCGRACAQAVYRERRVLAS